MSKTLSITLFVLLVVISIFSSGIITNCLLCHTIFKPTSTPTVIPKETPPKEAKLWKYDATCSRNGFIGVCNPSDYIMPDNPVIKYYSDRLFINKYGRLAWVNATTVGTIEFDGTLIFFYETDEGKWGKDDFWVNPDYTLTHRLGGDCEDISLVVASILAEKKIPYEVVEGYLTVDGKSYHDLAVEYKINGTYYTFFSGVMNTPTLSRKEFYKQKVSRGFDFEPLIMFKKGGYYTDYQSNW